MTPADIRHLAKLSEALGELTSVAAFCTVQGMDTRDPALTGKLNRDRLLNGIAGVVACIELAALHFGVDEKALTELICDKRMALAEWHDTARDKDA